MLTMSSKSLDDSFDESLFASEIVLERKQSRKESSSYYVDEYIKTFKQDNFLAKLKRRAIKGELRSCRFRSIAWRIYLDCLPDRSEEWVTTTRTFREEYQAIRNKYDTNPYRNSNHNFEENNPLSQQESSVWNKYFQDNELKNTITQDVVRTFPEIDFFQSSVMQEMMCNILFHFARENPKITYKQGMHELLAPILFVVNSDQQALLHAKELHLLESADESTRNEIEELLNQEYLEHDTYIMFRQVMETVEPWYSHEMISFKMDSINFEPFSTSLEPSSCSVLGIKLRLIYEKILKRVDSELFFHLFNMQIEPQIFGIRWLRLLFGREFSLQDLLVIWDAIFSDGISFSLCDYIFTAMLIVIRDLLLSSNYSQCMNHLMRYPSVPDTQYILDLALHLRDPINHPEPHGYTVGVHPIEVTPSPIHVILPDVIEQKPVPSTSSSSREISERNTDSAKTPNRPKTLPILQVNTSKNQVTNQQKSSISDQPQSGQSHAHQLQPVSQRQSQNGSSSPTKVVDHPLAHPLSSDDGPSSGYSPQLTPSFPSVLFKKKTQEMKSFNKPTNLNGKELDYCCELLTNQIDILQKTLAEEELKNNDVIFLAVAKLKIARDLLKGTLKLNEID